MLTLKRTIYIWVRSYFEMEVGMKWGRTQKRKHKIMGRVLTLRFQVVSNNHHCRRRFTRLVDIDKFHKCHSTVIILVYVNSEVLCFGIVCYMIPNKTSLYSEWNVQIECY